ncbi:DUF4222 domain-containing protein [Edwardsiella tarda]|uniref:DUF4222 domain-containing protein n=2 Tax=Edwardsiella tarda TaxID=636 RepID=UPI002FCCDF39
MWRGVSFTGTGGRMAKFPMVGHLYMGTHGHIVRVVSTCTERQIVTYQLTDPAYEWTIETALSIFKSRFRRLA